MVLRDFFHKVYTHVLKYITVEELFLITICFISRILFLSISLNEWDQINFAKALDDFAPTYGRPQLPGYILYVFLAWLIYLVTGNHLFSLTIVSAITSTLTILPIYRLTNKLFERTDLATLASSLFIVSPLFWIHSVVAMSDVCNVFFLSLAGYWLYLGIEEKKKFYLGSFCLALAMGVRLTNFIFCLFIPFIFLSRMHHKENKGNRAWMKEIKVFLKVIVIFVSTVLLWAVPTFYFAGGWYRYFYKLARSYEGSFYTHAIFADQKATLREIIQKSKAMYFALFRDSFGVGYLGNLYTFLTLPIILFGFILYLLKSDISDRKNQFLLLWFISYSAWLFPIMITTVYSRHLLPVIPAFFLMFIWGLKTPFEYFSTRFRKTGKYIKVLLVAPLLTAMLFQAVYSVNGLHTISSPYTQIVEYVKTNYSPYDIIVIVREERQHFEFLAPEYEILDAHKFETLLKDLLASKKTILVAHTAIQWGYVQSEDCQLIKEFSIDRRIYPKNSYTALYLYLGD